MAGGRCAMRSAAAGEPRGVAVTLRLKPARPGPLVSTSGPVREAGSVRPDGRARGGAQGRGQAGGGE
eukprot:1295751-Lingulodinium_polyedra.AAC.1